MALRKEDILRPVAKENQGKRNDLVQKSAQQKEESKTRTKVAKIAKVFGVGQSAIANRISRNPILKKSLSDKINISTINELLSGKMGVEVAKIAKVSSNSQ